MRGQPGFFDIDDRLKRLSDLGDQLETFRSAAPLRIRLSWRKNTKER